LPSAKVFLDHSSIEGWSLSSKMNTCFVSLRTGVAPSTLHLGFTSWVGSKQGLRSCYFSI
jgi:hypothetical protein